VIAAADREAVVAFLTRLRRLDQNAPVRVRPMSNAASDEPPARLWAMLPFRVLVSRRLSSAPPADITVSGAGLLDALNAGADGSAVPRRDEAWRWPLPSSEGRVVESIPAAEVVRLAAAAARTVRQAGAQGIGGRVVGERVLRDALLDHVAIVVTTDTGERVEIAQRMIQALVRMALVGRLHAERHDRMDTNAHGQQPHGHETNRSADGDSTTSGDSPVTVRLAMGWIGLSSPHGSAWYRPISPLFLS
jgi:hypothetical protein